MKKEQIKWFKKIMNSLSEQEENFLYSSVNLQTDKLNEKYFLNFEITNFEHHLLVDKFLYLYDLFNDKQDFNLSFCTNCNDLIQIKNCLLDILNLDDLQSNQIDLVYEDKYQIIVHDETLFIQLQQDNNLKKKIYTLGLLKNINDDIFVFVQPKKIEIKPINQLVHVSNNKNVSQADLNNNLFSKQDQFVDLSEIVNNKEQFLNNYINLSGEIFKIEEDDKPKFHVFKFYLTNYKDAIILKTFVLNKQNAYLANALNKEASNNKFSLAYLQSFSVGDWVNARVKFTQDKFEQNEFIGNILKIIAIDKPEQFKTVDEYDTKRIELNMHTTMSAFDGINEPKEIIKQMQERNSKIISINDFNSVQSFPTIYNLAKKNDIDIIYGAEFSFIKQDVLAVYNPKHIKLKNNSKTRLIFFDLETTGLCPNYDDIIEFGAYVTDTNQTKLLDYQQFIATDKTLDQRIINLTKITDEDLKDQIKIKDFLLKLHEFIQPDDVLVAHNGINFDIKFLNSWCRKCHIEEFNNPMIDTMNISKAFIEMASHRLGKISSYFNLEYDENKAHRANVDAQYLSNIFWKLYEKIDQLQDLYLDEWNDFIQTKQLYKLTRFNRICLQCKYKDLDGISSIKKLYELISLAHTTLFNNRPLLDYKTLEKNRKWFLVSNPAVDGDLFEIALRESDEYIVHWMQYFDYIQIAPLSCYKHLFDEYGLDIVKKNLQHIIDLALQNHILLVATSNAYYMEEYKIPIHKIYIYTKSLGGKRHRFYKGINSLTPHLYTRTTKQMLNEMQEFIHDEQQLKDVVINNSIKIYEMIERDQIPVQQKLFPPKIEGVEDKLKQEVFNFAKNKYGNNLPKEIEERINFELNIIISNGYSVVYWISHLLVQKSLQDGFLVGSRGSVGSSLVATCLRITEINPMKAHYYCANCHYFALQDNNEDSGYDLLHKQCPNCHSELIGEGQNIPFATFLGFKGDKVPDIDLNFSGLYQNNAHLFIKQMFGPTHTYRAGTIGTVAEKTAFGYVKDYLSTFNLYDSVSVANKTWLAINCMNTKRTTGQHPGGILIIPQDKSVWDFTPYNYPADNVALDWQTTHFAFEDIHDNVLKFDILGHDDPTVLKFLKDLTGIDPVTIPTQDGDVMSLFYDTKALKIHTNQNIYKEKNGAIGLPEFGTRFVREMLNETKPKTFTDLIRISGLSHGTNVWANNAQKLIKEGKQLHEVITCRDDIMIYLSSKGVESLVAFKIMEDIRKGKGLKEEYEVLMKQKNIPQWYIDSCKKIEYLFPKAHAAAYVLMAWRVAWYKVHYPLEYYATYFSVRCEVFDIVTMVKGQEAIYGLLNEITQKKKDHQNVSVKEEDLYGMLEVALEMCLRGYKFSNIDINRSLATQFVVDHENKMLIPPFNVLDGLGEAVANSIIEARQEHEFTSINDFKQRTKANKSNIDFMRSIGVFDHLNEDNQLQFDF